MLTHLERQHWAKLAALVKSAAADPGSAARTMGEAAKLARLVDVGMRRGTTAQVIMKATFPAPGQVVVTAGVVTTALNIALNWPDNYHVLGLKAYAVEGLSALQHLTMTLALNNGKPFYVDQNGAPAAIDFQTLQGTPIDPFLSFYPLDEYAQAQVPWRLTVSSSDVSGTTTYTPLVSFLVEKWDPIADPAPAGD